MSADQRDSTCAILVLVLSEWRTCGSVGLGTRTIALVEVPAHKPRWNQVTDAE